MKTVTYSAGVNKEHLLKILTKHNSLDPRTPIREYISNAYDASVGYPDAEIFTWAERNKLCIEDTGSGMTKEIILEGFTKIAGHISRVAEENSIGMFGIGVLSAFMIAESIVVRTRHFDEDHGWELIWHRNEIDFTLTPIEKSERGTLVILHLDEESLTLASNESLKSYIKKTFSLLKIPINVGNRVQHTIINPNYSWINTLERKEPGAQLLLDARAHSFFGEFKNIDLAAAYTALEPDGTRIFLGIPSGTYQRYDSHNVFFFSKGIYIEGKVRSYFPENMSFIIGIIESPHFQVQISREAINIENEHFKAVKAGMEAHVIRFLQLIANESQSAIEAILREHSTMLVAHTGPLRPQLIQILKKYYRFSTSAGELRWREIIPFIFKKADKKILYIITDSLGAYQDIFVKQTGNFIAVYVLDDADHLLLEEIAGEERVSLINARTIEGIEGSVDEIPEAFRKLGTSLTRFLVQRRIGGVNFVNISGEDQFPAFFRMKSSQGQSLMASGASAIQEEIHHIEALMLNIAHPLIQKLAGKRDLDSKILKETADTLYFIAVMHSPYTNLLLEINKEVVNSLIDKIAIKTNLFEKEKPLQYDHPTTFFAFPYHDDFKSVWEGVEETLQEKPYNWKVIRGDWKVDKPGIRENINIHIHKSHRYIADISGLNKNVIYELGIMEGVDSDRTLIICDDETFPLIPADLRGRLLKVYPTYLRENKTAFKNWFKRELSTLSWFENLHGSFSNTNNWKVLKDENIWEAGHNSNEI